MFSTCYCEPTDNFCIFLFFCILRECFCHSPCVCLYLCVDVCAGSEAQWAEQHAGSLQAEVTHSTLRGRWRLFSLQCAHPWAGELPHPQTRETHQEETVSRHTLGWDGPHISYSNSSQRLHYAPFCYRGERAKSWLNFLIDPRWWMKKLPQMLLAVVTLCNFPPFFSWHQRLSFATSVHYCTVYSIRL